MEFFHLLGSGAKFNKQRFQNDVEIFEKTNNTTVNITKDVETKNELLNELDFFKTTDKIREDNKKKSKAIKKEQEELVENMLKKGQQLTTEKDISAFRKEHNIKVYGTDVPKPFETFLDLTQAPYNLSDNLLKNLVQHKYNSPTPIQMQAIPIILKERDLMACAPTGSGKTLAYLLPILQELKKHEKVGYRALIIAPTRELVQQIDRELSKLCNGTKIKTHLLTKPMTAAEKAQLPEQRQKYDILISTPMRLIYAIKEKEIELNQVKHLILDEADKLLELGFLEQTDEIFAAFNGSIGIRKAMFSATFSSTVEQLATTVMNQPIRIVIGSKNAATTTIKQQLLFTGNEAGKMIALRQYIKKGIKPPVLIFVQSIERAKELFKELVFDGINVEVIHADRTKAQRELIIDQFRLGKIWVLIATELMARGLDFKGVNLVINYDFPQTVQSYIHRIGRTGRAGRQGEAITYFTKDDIEYLRTIVNVMKESGCDVPDWMLSLKKPSHKKRKILQKGKVERDNIDTTSKYDKKRAAKLKSMIEGSKRRKRKAQAKEKEESKKAKTNQSTE